MASVVNIETKRNQTWAGLTVQFLLNDVPVDLSEATIIMQIKKEPCSPTPEVEFTTTDGSIVITNAVEGRFAIGPYKFDLPPRNYYYDILVEHGSNSNYDIPTPSRFDYVVDVSRFEITSTVSSN